MDYKFYYPSIYLILYQYASCIYMPKLLPTLHLIHAIKCNINNFLFLVYVDWISYTLLTLLLCVNIFLYNAFSSPSNTLWYTNHPLIIHIADGYNNSKNNLNRRDTLNLLLHTYTQHYTILDVDMFKFWYISSFKNIYITIILMNRF